MKSDAEHHGPHEVPSWRSVAKLRSECGSVLIETAASYMLGMAMVLGIIEVCVMAYTYGVLSEAARNGVRYACIHGTSSSSCSGPSTGCADTSAANVVSQVTSFAGTFMGNAPGITVNVSYPDTTGSAAPSRVIVSVSYPYQPLFALFGMRPTFQVSEQGRIVY